MNLFFAACLVSYTFVAFLIAIEIFDDRSMFTSLQRLSLWVKIPLFVAVQVVSCHLSLFLAWALFWSPDLPTSQDFLKLTLTVLVGPTVLAILCQVGGFLFASWLVKSCRPAALVAH